jgi:hypothetical protein
MSPLIHLLLAFLIAYALTKNWKYRLLAAFGGIIPDIDGIHILFDLDTYYAIHHVIAHPPFAGFLLGIAVVAVFPFVNKHIIETVIFPKKSSNAFIKTYRKEPFKVIPAYAFFMVGFFIHNIADIIGTNWPINLLYPFGVFNASIHPLVSNEVIYSIINPFFAILSITIFVFIIFKEYKKYTGKNFI